MKTVTNKEKVEELKNIQLKVFGKISANADAKVKAFIESFEKFLIPIFDESFEEVEPFELDYMIKKLQQLEKELDKNLPKKCWCYSVKDDADDAIYLKTYQAEIKKIEEFQGEKMYYTSQGIYPEHNIAFTEIDACRKAKEHFETVQHNTAVLIAQAEAKIKELEHKTK